MVQIVYDTEYRCILLYLNIFLSQHLQISAQCSARKTYPRSQLRLLSNAHIRFHSSDNIVDHRPGDFTHIRQMI